MTERKTLRFTDIPGLKAKLEKPDAEKLDTRYGLGAVERLARQQVEQDAAEKGWKK